MKLSQLQHKKIAILGFGKEGQSTLRFLQKQGIVDITILDAKTICLPNGFHGNALSGSGYLNTL